MTDFNDYIRITDETAVYPGAQPHPLEEHEPVINTRALIYCALGLAGEAGEVVDVIKKDWRNTESGSLPAWRTADIRAELGDLMWYVARLCKHLGISMDQILEENVLKLRARKDAGTLKMR